MTVPEETAWLCGYYGFDSSQLSVPRFRDLLRIRTQLPDVFTRSPVVACLQS